MQEEDIMSRFRWRRGSQTCPLLLMGDSEVNSAQLSGFKLLFTVDFKMNLFWVVNREALEMAGLSVFLVCLGGGIGCFPCFLSAFLSWCILYTMCVCFCARPWGF